MNITVNQLRIFVMVAKEGSVTRASEKLFMTQPAVSIQVKKLEEQLGENLFELHGRKLSLTNYGAIILESAKSIMNEFEEIEDKTLAYKGVLSGKLTISVVSTGKYVMPFYLEKFLADHPGIQLTMDVTNRQNVVEHLRKNDVDFALVSVLPPELELEEVQLIDNELVLVGNTSAAATQEKLTTKGLSKLPLIYREEGSATRVAMEQFLKDNKIIPQKMIQLTSNEAIKQALLAGLGYSIMPVIGIKGELIKGSLKIIDLPGLPLMTKWRLVYLKHKRLSTTAIKYLEYLEKDKKTVAKLFDVR